MPRNHQVASEQWERYVYGRETGHLEFLHKARKCEDFFAGYPDLQWDPSALSTLRTEHRPALTINKVLSTLSSIVGEQIDLRTETAFRARYGADSSNAEALTKVFRFISDKNTLNWVRTQMFADGVITSRGYVDVRMDFTDSVTGDVKIVNLNPRNVIPDPDASEYDPDTWGDVIVTRWHTVDEIAQMYNEEDAKALGLLTTSNFVHGYDSIDQLRDRFGNTTALSDVVDADKSMTRMIRVLERQHKKLSKIKYFVDLRTGVRKRIPETMDREKMVFLLDQAKRAGEQIAVDEVVGQRIKWTVTADEFVLHDEWSPYQHFTVVPYFPYFRQGRTVGLTENLIGPQELLNKTTSQELHVVNTTANSGWKIKKGSLKNMTMDELESTGAKSGLVLELESTDDAEKIQPNQIPAGLDRLSSKAENYIKSVSARGDAQMGMTRADVSADQIEANNAFGDVGLKWPLDNLVKTDFILARNVLAMVQEYYTDPRIMLITQNVLTGEQTEVRINWPDPETGEVLNDVSLGEYEIVVISQPTKQTLEETQFDQLAYMKEKLGIPIPDEFLIENSSAQNKTALVAALKAQAESPAAIAAQEMQVMGQKLELANLKADAARLEADTVLKRAKAGKEVAQAAEIAGQDPADDAEMMREQARHEQEMQMQREKHEQEMQMQREKAQLEAETKRAIAAEEVRLKRAQAIMAMRQPAGNQPGQQPSERKAA